VVCVVFIGVCNFVRVTLSPKSSVTVFDESVLDGYLFVIEMMANDKENGCSHITPFLH